MSKWRKEVFTEEEAAAFLMTSPRRIRRLVEEGKLAVVRDGPKYTRFLRAYLEDYLYRHSAGPPPRAKDMACLRAYLRQTEGWRQVYETLVGEKDEGPSIVGSLHAYFPGEESEGLASTLRDLEWQDLRQASRTLVDELSIEQGTLTALVQACQKLVRVLSERDSSIRDFTEGTQRERRREANREERSVWSDTPMPSSRKSRKEVFTEEEAAAFLMTSTRRIRRLVEEGELATVRDGLRYTRFLRAHLLDYLCRHHVGPPLRAEDFAVFRAHRRQTESWRQVYETLVGEKDEGLSIVSSLHTYFPGEEAEGLATILRDLEWSESMQASRTLVDELSIVEESGTLTALVQTAERLALNCETLLEQLPGTVNGARGLIEPVLEREGQEGTPRRLLDWSDTLTPCCRASWRLPRLEEGEWEAARVCTRCNRIWILTELREALAKREAEEESRETGKAEE